MLFCRLCDLEVNPQLCRFIFDENIKPPIWKIIAELANLTISKTDPYTKTVCSYCFDNLEKFHIFRETVLETDQKIRHNHCNNNNNIEQPEKDPENGSFIDVDCTVIKIEDEDYVLEEEIIEIEEPTVNFENEIKDHHNGGNQQIDENLQISDISVIPEKVHNHSTRTRSNLKLNSKHHQCNICNKTFYCRSMLNIHTKIHDTRNSKIVTQKSNLQQHIVTKPYKCKICNIKFTLKQSLQTHSRKHESDRPFQCNVCDKTFIRKDNLKSHVKLHLDDKPYKCSECDKQFSSKQHFKFHLESHNDKQYQCNVCKRKFSHKIYLEKHSTIHTGIKPYECNQCDKRFARKDYLQTHLKTHNPYREYQCHICDKKFILKPHLNSHLLIHSGEKPHKCGICNKRFTRNDNLRKHEKTHKRIDNDSFQCRFCDIKFLLKQHLRNHLKQHKDDVI